MHNRLVDRILQCAMHVALTLRTKTEYVIEDNGNGKKTPRKIGMAPVFRDGIEYEVTIFFELDQSHAAAATKDRTGIFDGQYFMIDPNTGKQIYQWLAGGAAEPSSPLPIMATQSEPEDDTPLPAKVEQVMQRYCANMTREEKEVVAAKIKSITGGTANYRAVTDEAILQRIYDTFKGAPNASGMEG